MSAFLSSLPLLVWAQAGAPQAPPNWLLWFFVVGEPAVTIKGLPGGLLTWIKVLGLFCLLGWVLSWAVAALKEQTSRTRMSWLDMGGLGADSACFNSLCVSRRKPSFTMLTCSTISAIVH